MPIAPLVAAWRDRWPSVSAGPLQAGSDFGGVPFQNQYILAQFPNARLKVELGFGDDLTIEPQNWNLYDVTNDVRQAEGNGIDLTPFGRSDEFATAQPAGCSFKLDNTSGSYTAYNPNSQYSPNVRRNTPVRVTVTLTGQATDAFVVFHGYANGFEPSWDISANLAVVTVSASGVTRRLQQGKSQAKSPIRRFYESASLQPIAYWPLEEPSGSISGASALASGTPMTASGGTSDTGGVKFGKGVGRDQPAYTGFEILKVGTDPLASLGAGGRLDGTVPISTVSPMQWAVQFLGRLWATGSGSDVTIVSWTTPNGTYARWDVRQQTVDGAIVLVGVTPLGAETTFLTSVAAPVDLVRFAFSATQNGGNIDLIGTVSILSNAGIGGYMAATTSVAGTLTAITSISANPNESVLDPGVITPSGNLNNDIVVGHLGIWERGTNVPRLVDSYTDPDTGKMISPWSGYVGESAVSRIARLCREEGMPIEISGTSANAMDIQSTDSFVNLLRDCEAVDHGLLYDGHGPGLGYVARSLLYNEAATLTVDASLGQVGYPFEPKDDDQRNRNKVTISRKNGSSATYEDSTGPMGTEAIGVYDSSSTLSLQSDTDPINHAAWLVHQGTAEGFRYPTLRLNLGAESTAVLADDWLRQRLLNRIDVTNVSSKATQHPAGTVSLILEGWSQFLSPFDWTVTANCSPYSPWVVGVLDTSGFLDCGASSLTSGIDATQTGVDVTVNDDCLWTHSAGDFDVVIGPEVMTVTAVDPLVSDTFTRSVSNGWGTNDTGHAYTLTGVGGSVLTSDWQVTGTVGTMSVPVSAGYRFSYLPTVSYAEVEAIATFSSPVAATGDALEAGGIILRATSVTSYYLYRAHLNTDNSISANIYSPTGVLFATATLPGLTYTAGMQLKIRAKARGSVHSVKVWQASANEPETWTASGVNTEYLGAGFVAVRSGIAASNSNTKPVVFTYDNFQVLYPQRFTVTRSVNGVVATHGTGAEVHVADPFIVAL